MAKFTAEIVANLDMYPVLTAKLGVLNEVYPIKHHRVRRGGDVSVMFHALECTAVNSDGNINRDPRVDYVHLMLTREQAAELRDQITSQLDKGE